MSSDNKVNMSLDEIIKMNKKQNKGTGSSNRTVVLRGGNKPRGARGARRSAGSSRSDSSSSQGGSLTFTRSARGMRQRGGNRGNNRGGNRPVNRPIGRRQNVSTESLTAGGMKKILQNMAKNAVKKALRVSAARPVGAARSGGILNRVANRSRVIGRAQGSVFGRGRAPGSILSRVTGRTPAVLASSPAATRLVQQRQRPRQRVFQQRQRVQQPVQQIVERIIERVPRQQPQRQRVIVQRVQQPRQKVIVRRVQQAARQPIRQVIEREMPAPRQRVIVKQVPRVQQSVIRRRAPVQVVRRVVEQPTIRYVEVPARNGGGNNRRNRGGNNQQRNVVERVEYVQAARPRQNIRQVDRFEPSSSFLGGRTITRKGRGFQTIYE